MAASCCQPLQVIWLPRGARIEVEDLGQGFDGHEFMVLGARWARQIGLGQQREWNLGNLRCFRPDAPGFGDNVTLTQGGLPVDDGVRSGKIAAVVIWLILCFQFARAQNFNDIKPSPQQVEWQDLEFGVLIHFGTNTYLDREWGDGTASPQVFNPTQLDPEQWLRAAKAAGAKYVVLVAKHHDGFCLWPTQQTDYSVKSSPWENGKGDVVKRVSDAAHKLGMKFGVYLSPWDRHEPRYKNSAEYDDYYAAELDELTSGYGDLVEFWLDGAGSEGHVYNFPRIIETLRKSQPNTLVFADAALFEYGDIRWAGNEDGKIPYENWNVLDRHGYLRWRPVEADTPLHKGALVLASQ